MICDFEKQYQRYQREINAIYLGSAPVKRRPFSDYPLAKERERVWPVYL